MATRKAGKRSKTAKEALEEIVDKGKEFIGKTKKSKKKSRSLIFRDPLTGKRDTNYSIHPYKPSFRGENRDQQSASEAIASSSAIDGKIKLMVAIFVFCFKKKNVS